MYSEKNETIQMAKTYLSAYYHNLFDTEYISIPEKGHLCNPIIEKPAGKRGRQDKGKTKVSGCFRTSEGADTFGTIMSYLGTAKKRGIRPMMALQKAIRLESNFIFEY